MHAFDPFFGRRVADNDDVLPRNVARLKQVDRDLARLVLSNGDVQNERVDITVRANEKRRFVPSAAKASRQIGVGIMQDGDRNPFGRSVRRSVAAFARSKKRHARVFHRRAAKPSRTRTRIAPVFGRFAVFIMRSAKNTMQTHKMAVIIKKGFFFMPQDRRLSKEAYAPLG